MKFTSVFDIIGPVMIGPSSSHTAGAARIGRVARIYLVDNLNGQKFIYMDHLQKRIEGMVQMLRL